MKRFYERQKDHKFYEVELDEFNLEIKTRYDFFYVYYQGTNSGRKSAKKYKKLETTQRNFEKKCKDLEAKGYVLSDPTYPLRTKQKIEIAQINKHKDLSVPIFHEGSFEEIAKMTHLEELELRHGGYDIIDIPESLTQLKNLKELSVVGIFGKLPDTIGDLKKLEKLHISQQGGISKLPQSLANCSALKELQFDYTDVEELPLNIGKLKKLVSINASSSSLKEFPLSIGDCEALKDIDIDSCPVKDLPESFGNLDKLEKFSASYCSFANFPLPLTKLKNIESLDMSGCHITSMPPEIGNMTSLKKLSLQGWQKKITVLPDEIGNLTNLEELDIDHNDLKTIPNTIGNLSSLKILVLGQNKLTQLPETLYNLANLNFLRIEYNLLKKVPKGLLKLKRLERIGLIGNPFEDLTEEMQRKDKDTIFKYLGWIEAEKVPTLESNLTEYEQRKLVMPYQVILEELMGLSKSHGHYDNEVEWMESISQFLLFETDEVPQIPVSYNFRGGIKNLWKLLSPIDAWTEIDHRLMHALTKNNWGNPNEFIDKTYNDYTSEIFFEWYEKQLEGGNEPDYEKVETLLKEYEKEDDLFEVLLSKSQNLRLIINNKPTQFSERIIKHLKENPEQFFKKIDKHGLGDVLLMLIQFSLKDIEPYLEDWIFYGGEGNQSRNNDTVFIRFNHLRMLYYQDAKKYEHLILKASNLKLSDSVLAQIAVDLKDLYTNEHHELSLQLAQKSIDVLSNGWSHNHVFIRPLPKSTYIDYMNWLVTHFRKDNIIESLFDFVKINVSSKYVEEYYNFLIKSYPKEAPDFIAEQLRKEEQIDKIIAALKDHNIRQYSDHFWYLLNSSLLAHRKTAATYLTERPKEEIYQKVEDLLASNEPSKRDGAVQLLYLLEDDKARDILKEALQTTQEEDLRKDLIAYWVKAGANDFVKEEVFKTFEARKAAGKLKKYPKKWLDTAKLPDLYWKNGDVVEAEFIRHLLQKQKAQKDTGYTPTQEVLILLEDIDKTKSGDFAKKVLDLELKNGGLKSPNKAVSPFITLLGDDRVIDPLKRYCTQNTNVVAATILGLMNNAKAARALDGIMLHFKSKYPNVRQAASTSFNQIADTMGISRMELMDKMIPDFGFENLFKTFEINGEEWRAFIKTDLKIAYLNELDEIKKSLPSKAAKEIKDEIKVINKEIRSISKNQKQNLEQNFIAQRRWKGADWQAHFMGKALMFAFAQSLIWGIYEDGKLTEIFGVNQDQTLENAEFDEIEIPENSTIGMVHPLELDEAAKKTWKTYLNENNIVSPFQQIDRAIFLPEHHERNIKIIEKYKDVKVSDYRFRSLLEKRGWRRGSVVDGGMIDNYKKLYEGDNIEVFVEVDEMYVYLGEYSEEVVIQEIYFSKVGTFQTGSYYYNKFNDNEKVLSIKDLPHIVYSETMYDFHLLTE